MIKYILSGLLAFLLLSCNNHVNVSESELKEIYSELIIADSTPGAYLSLNSLVIDSIENFTDKKMSVEGISYKIGYCDLVKNGIWNSQLFNIAKVVPLDSVFHRLSAGFREYILPHYSFSLPYFSVDKKSFLIYYNYYCGSLCAESSLRLYKKVNGKWVHVKNYSCIVS